MADRAIMEEATACMVVVIIVDISGCTREANDGSSWESN